MMPPNTRTCIISKIFNFLKHCNVSRQKCKFSFLYERNSLFWLRDDLNNVIFTGAQPLCKIMPLPALNFYFNIFY